MAGLVVSSRLVSPLSFPSGRRLRVSCELEAPEQEQSKKKQGISTGSTKMQVDSTDWIASSLTRRFGLGAGLAYVGFLAFGVVSEQIKTRNEVALEEQGTRDVEGGEEVVLPNGIRYEEVTIGGGAFPRAGDLVIVDLVGKCSSTGKVFVDTITKNRPLVFVFGAKPYSGGVCNGVESVLKTMKAGGKRRAMIPSELGFGEQGATFDEDVKVGPSEKLDYTIWLRKVSIAP